MNPMNATRARRAAAGIAGAILATLSVFGGVTAATAAPAYAASIDPDAVTEIVVHKFEEPIEPGTPANGLPQDTTGLTPVNGATFTATRIPGIDLTTNAGQQQAAALTIADAAALVAGLAPDATGTTGSGGEPVGVTTLGPLGVGLYFVKETVTPAGFVGAASFIVALPLTHPVELDRWLTTVHVYPKNARAHIELDVIDADAVKLGDEVEWISRSDIPPLSNIDGYRVVQQIDPKLVLIDNGEHVKVSLDAPGAPTLVEGVDYTIVVSPDRRTVTVDFTERGREVLAEVNEQHPGAEVRIDYRTTVLAEGDLYNKALLYPSKATIDGDPGAPDPLEAVNHTKWGPLSVLVHEYGNPSNLIPGARFELFRTEEDARARRNPIVVEGVQEWTTDAQGRLIINGLRFSDFANGLDRETSDPLYRLYWAVPTHIPSGWVWVDDRPLAGAVNSSVEFQTLIFEVKLGNDLPVTGGQIAGAAILAVLLLGGGAALLLARRRRREPEGHAES